MTVKALIAVLLITVCLCSCKGAGAYGSAGYSESYKPAKSCETQSKTNKKTDNTVTEEEVFGEGAQTDAGNHESTEKSETQENKEETKREENSGTNTVSTEEADPSDTSSEPRSKESYVSTDGYGSIIP